MLKLQVTTKFKKDYKRVKKRGLDLNLLKDVIDTLLQEQKLVLTASRTGTHSELFDL